MRVGAISDYIEAVMGRSVLLSVVVTVMAACSGSSSSSGGGSPSTDASVVDPPASDGASPGPVDTPAPGPGDSPALLPTYLEPSFAVTIGGPPASCQVFEFQLPIEAHDGEHKAQGSVITYAHNPPMSGPNYEMWAKYQRYTETLARPHWVHNLRHGGIVLVYRPDAPADTVDILAQALDQVPAPTDAPDEPVCPRMGIMTPDPQLEDTYAVLAHGWMMTSNCTPKLADVAAFANRHVFRAPEKTCGDGAWPVRAPCFRFEDVPATQLTEVVPEGTSVVYEHNPPTSGPYYANTLKYGRYDVVVPEPYWTGILVKGGIVVLYRPDAPADLIQELQTQYDALPAHWDCGHSMTAMVQDPSLENPYAFVAFNQYMTGKCLQGFELTTFVTSRRGWGPLESCADGTFVP